MSAGRRSIERSPGGISGGRGVAEYAYIARGRSVTERPYRDLCTLRLLRLLTASVLMSMGMIMPPPVVVSLPFKLIFFVLVDGWTLVAGSLVQSYGT